MQALIKGNDLEGIKVCIEEARGLPPLQFRRSGRGRERGREGRNEGGKFEGGREGGEEGGREGGLEVSMVQLALDGPFTEYQVTALMLATYLGHEEMVGLLLKEGAEVHARALGGGTSLNFVPPSLPPSLLPSLLLALLLFLLLLATPHPPSLPPSLPP